MMKDKNMDAIITTVSNKKALSKNCRLIDKKYYFIGDVKKENSGDVYNINGRFIRVNTNRIVYNHSINEYQLKNDSLINGIVKLNEDSPIFGHFNLDNLKCCLVILKDLTQYWCINENVLNLNFREEMSSGIFYHISLKPSNVLNAIKSVSKEYKESLSYDSKDILERYIKNYNENYNPIITDAVKDFTPILKDLTFGLEFETTKGVIPNNKLNILPLIPLRDGSIDGLEYVTIPLSGEKGVQALIDSAVELNKRTEYNNSCSLHYHIGNIPRTPEFILAFYKVISHFQEELFELFPLHKKYNFGVKRKSYSKPFPFNIINCQLDPSIDCNNKDQLIKNFKVIFDYFAEIIPFEAYGNDLEKVLAHPLDERGNAKWNINTRYYAVNFIPLIFGNKKTIEFRIHTPTYNIDKILNFLFINSYLINYTKENYSKILKDPTLLLKKDLIRFVSNYISNSKTLNSNNRDLLIDYHISYINTRKDYIYDFNSKGDIIGNEDLIKFNSFIDWTNNKSLSNFNYRSSSGNRFEPQRDNRVLHRKPKRDNPILERKYYKTSVVERLIQKDLPLKPIFYGTIGDDVHKDITSLYDPRKAQLKKSSIDSKIEQLNSNMQKFQEFEKEKSMLDSNFKEELLNDFLDLKIKNNNEKDI